MKLRLVFLLVVLAISSGVAQERCSQGHSYNEDCNVCTCIDSGIYVCTERACYNGPQFSDTPTPAKKKRDVEETGCDKGKSYFNDCNLCFCVDDKFYTCTPMDCNQDPLQVNNLPLQKKETDDTVTWSYSAEPSNDERYRREVEDSTGKYDAPRPNQLPFLRFDVERCTPYEVKNKECNRCKCTKNGKGWLCTKRECPVAA